MPKGKTVTQEEASEIITAMKEDADAFFAKASEAIAQPIDGWAPKGRWRRAVCNGLGTWEDLAPAEGAEPLWAEVNAALTFDELDAIPGGNTTYEELFKYVIPNVRAWNVTRLDRETGQRVPVPPPTEGGEASLRAAPRLLTDWLAACLKFGHIGVGNPELLGKSPQPSSTPDGSSESS